MRKELDKIKDEKSKKEKQLEEDLDFSNKSNSYQELEAEAREENKNNNGDQIMDEEGNEINFDDLTEEEKMNILQQHLFLQKLQEEAEARGEDFDPQEYLDYLEQQEEQELMKNENSNKPNKSF